MLFTALQIGLVSATLTIVLLRGTVMSTLTVFVFGFTFLSGVSVGAWLNGLANRPRRSAVARR